MQEKHEEVIAIADFSSNLLQESQENTEKSCETAVNYLEFNKNDVLLRVCSYENGWCYGSLLQKPENPGFFPSNYVRPREVSAENLAISQETQAISPKKRKAEGNWLDFMQEILQNDSKAPSFSKQSAETARNLSENDVLNESLVQKNYNSIIGYKKIKISSDPSQPLKKRPQFAVGNSNPTPVLNNEFAMVRLFLEFVNNLLRTIHIFKCFLLIFYH